MTFKIDVLEMNDITHLNWDIRKNIFVELIFRNDLPNE